MRRKGRPTPTATVSSESAARCCRRRDPAPHRDPAACYGEAWSGRSALAFVRPGQHAPVLADAPSGRARDRDARYGRDHPLCAAAHGRGEGGDRSRNRARSRGIRARKRSPPDNRRSSRHNSRRETRDSRRTARKQRTRRARGRWPRSPRTTGSGNCGGPSGMPLYVSLLRQRSPRLSRNTKTGPSALT